MALGDRIRYFRKWRGLTQQELGEAVGFSKGSADVRIGQYESNAKKPREETLLALDSNEPDFEDGLVRACAELNDADFIISRDEKAFRKATIRRVTAKEYLDEIAE